MLLKSSLLLSVLGLCIHMQFSLLDLQQVVYQATGAQHCYHSCWHDFLRFGESDAHDDSKNCLEQLQTSHRRSRYCRVQCIFLLAGVA